MTAGDEWRRSVDGGVELLVRVVPGARTSEIVGVVEGRLKVKLAARPVDGQANEELCRVVAAWCGVRASAVEITKGSTSRTKTLLVRNLPKLPTLLR